MPLSQCSSSSYGEAPVELFTYLDAQGQRTPAKLDGLSLSSRSRRIAFKPPVIAFRPWNQKELALLGAKSDAEVARLTGRPYKRVWAKRRELGISQPYQTVRPWTEAEDRIVRSCPPSEAARILRRTVTAVKVRRGRLAVQAGEGLRDKLLDESEVQDKLTGFRYDSNQQEEVVRFVGGPYGPPRLPGDGVLRCAIHGRLKVGGYTNTVIPWPVASGHPSQRIICGDLLKALRTESREAIVFHFGLSRAFVSELRRRLGIPRYNAGSHRLFRRNIDLARTPEALEKQSRYREGRPSGMSPQDRRKLQVLQSRAKPTSWRRRMSERLRATIAKKGVPRKWTAAEIALLWTMPDREIAEKLGRSFSAVKGMKFKVGRDRAKLP